MRVPNHSVAGHYDRIIVGGGVMGTAAARRFSMGGLKVAVVDPKIDNALQASQNNAGAGRRLHWEGPSLELIDFTLRLFKQLGERINYREEGYLWLHSEKSWKAAQDNARRISQRYGVKIDMLEGLSEIQRVCPEIADLSAVDYSKADVGFEFHMPEVVGAAHSKQDCLFDPNMVVRAYREDAEDNGADFLQGFYVTDVERTNGLEHVHVKNVAQLLASDGLDNSKLKELMGQTPQQVAERADLKDELFTADEVIWCNGAWARWLFPQDEFALVWPQRRTNVSITGPVQSRYNGFVALGAAYFHADGPDTNGICKYNAGNALGEPFDPIAFLFNNNGERFFREHILYHLSHRTRHLTEETIKYYGAFNGLYPQTLDGNGIFTNNTAIGTSGHGMMISAGVPELIYLASVLRDPYALEFIRQFSPYRFAAGQLLPSGLHI